jgi:uncharacterized protein (TIGR02646 family)
MIKIERCSCPGVLKNSPSEGTKYRCKKVVCTLWRMQHGKCCYCEQLIPDKGHSKTVDHFHPKSIFKYLKNDWKNLLLACPQCNGKKSDKFPVELTNELDEKKIIYLKTKSGANPLIINPSNPNIDPEEHIDFNVDIFNPEWCGIIKEKNNSTLGRKTIDTIGLDGRYYTNLRKKLCRDLIFYYLSFEEAIDKKDDVKIHFNKNKFEMMMSAKSEFAAFVRSFARHNKMDKKPFNLKIPFGAETG